MDPPGKRSMNYKKLFLITLIITILDQLTKTLVYKEIIKIPYTINTGAAFGTLQSFNQELIWFSIIVIGTILLTHDKIEDKYVLFTAILLGGILGNLIDRIYLHGVLDFINLGFWPAFNIADVSINIGVFGIIIKSFQNSSKSSNLAK